METEAQEELPGLTVFICGQKPDHKCDTNGPELCGGENPDGTLWQGSADIQANRQRAQWGSVSCSVCGQMPLFTDMW
jgi:hypothetical protein